MLCCQRREKEKSEDDEGRSPAGPCRLTEQANEEELKRRTRREQGYNYKKTDLEECREEEQKEDVCLSVCVPPPPAINVALTSASGPATLIIYSGLFSSLPASRYQPN